MKYNWDIIGHKKHLEQLEAEIESGNVSHAYLFSGPKDTGKFRVARVFAGILECNDNYCGKCKDCHLIKQKTHPDVILMKDNRESIKIDEIREISRKSSLTFQSKYRIIIIENIERMPIPAQNSFLKTLEEPIGNTIFILTSTEVDKVLTTIKSRVRQFSFSNIETDTLRKYLEGKFSNKSNIEEVINIAQGRPGLAINLMNNIEDLAEQKEIYNQIDMFIKNNNIAKKITYTEKLCDDKSGKLLNLFFDSFYRYLRKLIFDYIENNDNLIKNRFSLKEIINLFENLEKTRYLIDRNVNKKLALENFFLETEKSL